MRVAMEPAPWWAAAAENAAYGDKLAAYRKLADADLAAEEYAEFCDRHLPHVDEAMAEYIGSEDFDQLLVDTVQRTFPPAEHDHFVPHYRGLLRAWVDDQA